MIVKISLLIFLGFLFSMCSPEVEFPVISETKACIKELIPAKPYAQVKTELVLQREILRLKYSGASEKEKSQILKSTGELLDSVICEVLFPYWEGTPWDFNGHTDIPNTGEIACGYLVSTLLTHAGFKLNRYKMAQQSSLSEIKTLGQAELLGTDSEEALEKIRSKKNGLYILGLSAHVGYIRIKNGIVYFLHSTYLAPTAVVNEKAVDSDAFNYSSIYYIGEISTNTSLVKKWLFDERVLVVLD